MAKIHFASSGREVEFEAGEETNLLRASIRYEGGIPYKCGGGLCGTCKIFVQEGSEHLTPVKKQEVARLGDLLNQGYRLACQTFAKDSCSISWDGSVQVEENRKLKEYWEKQG